MALKTFEIDLAGRGSALAISVDPTSTVPLHLQLVSSVRRALTKVAEVESFYERYGDSFGDPNNSRVEAIVIQAVQAAQAANITGEGDFTRAAYLRICSGLAESFDDSQAVTGEAFAVFGDPDDMANGLEAIAGELGIVLNPAEEGYDGVGEWLLSEMERAIENADHSSAQDVIRRMGPIRMVYRERPEGGSPYLDDTTINFDTHFASADEVVPDESFIAFLKLINLSANHYVGAVKAHHGVDLMNPDECRRASLWQAVANGNEPANLMRPPVVNPATAVEIVENSYTSCNPVLVLDMPVDTLMKMAPGSLLLVRGGQVGLHDFINGAGHITAPSRPMRVRSDMSFWEAERGRVNSVYDCISQAYAAEVEVHKPSPQRALPFAAGLER